MIIVSGAAGQLGADVVSELGRRGIGCLGIDIGDLDITDRAAVAGFVSTRAPTCVVHCAAYTAVDAAEDDEEICMRVNAGGSESIAAACREAGAEMIYVSTDYVFGGQGGDAPHEVDDPKAPLSVYGRSKLAGEEAVARLLERYYIVRTSWVYGKEGGGNFVKTMLRLARERDEISVVDDQVGSPTYTVDLAALLCDMALSGKYGAYHATNEGFCSWAEFARDIMRQSGGGCKITSITTDMYPTKAARPKNSRLSKASLDKAGFARLPHWKDALGRYL